MGTRGTIMSTLPDNVVRDVSSVLASAPKGVAINRFDKDYKLLTKTQLPYRHYGYDKPISLLRDLEKKGIVSIEPGVSKDGGWRVYSRGYNSFMPSWIEKLSKRAPSKSRENTVDNAKNTATGKDSHKKHHDYSLSYDQRGLVSLYVVWKYKDKKKSVQDMSGCELHHKSVSKCRNYSVGIFWDLI